MGLALTLMAWQRPGRAALLVYDELKPDNQNMVARYLHQYVFHVTSVKRR